MDRKATAIVAAGLAFASAGCASLTAATSPDAPIILAYTAPVETIQRGADGGDNASQFALSFLALYGLRGVEADLPRALELRRRASQPTRTMITQYIPAIGGGAGRTNVIPITVPGLNGAQMDRLQLCGLALLVESPELAQAACMDPQTYARAAPAARMAALRAQQGALRAQIDAAQAAAESAASTPSP